MTDVYLCIGTQKTGTTTLQYFMRANEAALGKQDCCYPYMDIGLPDDYYKNRNAHFLVHRARGGQNETGLMQEKAFCILGELAEKYSKIVLSDEIIWYKCRGIENFWEKLIRNFEKINCRVKVVVYLRRQDDLIQSLWNQKVKDGHGLEQDFKTWIEPFVANFPFDYYSHLKWIESFVGKENMIVRVYGEWGENDTLLSDYLHILGIIFNDEFIVENESRNPGLTGNYIEIKRIINGIPEYREMGNFLRQPLVLASSCQKEQSSGEKTSMFSFEERLAFIERFKEGNRKTAEEFLGKTDGILFERPIPNLPEWKVNSEKMYRDIISYMVEAFCVQERKIVSLKNEIASVKKEISEKSSIIRRIGRRLKKLWKAGSA